MTSDAELDRALNELQAALRRFDDDDLNLISSDEDVIDKAPPKKGKQPLKRVPTFSASTGSNRG